MPTQSVHLSCSMDSEGTETVNKEFELVLRGARISNVSTDETGCTREINEMGYNMAKSMVDET